MADPSSPTPIVVRAPISPGRPGVAGTTAAGGGGGGGSTTAVVVPGGGGGAAAGSVPVGGGGGAVSGVGRLGEDAAIGAVSSILGSGLLELPELLGPGVGAWSFMLTTLAVLARQSGDADPCGD
jgi:hypothetical protein